MAIQIPEKFNDIIANSEFIWFTTVREDGMPQPTPVWYVRDGDTFLIYSMPDAQKVRNIRANPKVALGLANEDAGDYFVVHGEAVIDESIPSANRMPAYAQKYKESIKGIGYTPETHAQTWSLPIRVTPMRVHGETE
jgi:PPOX class probable F420-dependent enzyme